MFKVFVKIASVFRSGLPHIGTFALLHVVQQLTSVGISVTKRDHTLTMHFFIQHISSVDKPIETLFIQRVFILYELVQHHFFIRVKIVPVPVNLFFSQMLIFMPFF